MQSAPEISIILPTCDRPTLVGRAVRSVLEQAGPSFEVILVDANRTTPESVGEAALAPWHDDSRMRIINARDRVNAAAARNAGLAVARGRWITFLDDDDEYLPGKLASQHALAEQTGAPLVVCGYEFVWPHRVRVRQTERSEFRGDDILRHANLGSPLLFHRRTADVRFDERLSAGEDMLYAQRLLLSQRQRILPCVPRALVRVHGNAAPTSVHRDKEAIWRAYRATLRIAQQQFSREACRTFLLHGRLERGIGGYGSGFSFLATVCAVLRARGWSAGRLAAYALLARRRSAR